MRRRIFMGVILSTISGRRTSPRRAAPKFRDELFSLTTRAIQCYKSGTMKSVRAAVIAILVGIGVALMGVAANAQQPTALSTPAPRNPNWCPDVPASKPPLNNMSPEVWARRRKTCMSSSANEWDNGWECRNLCMGARELWWRASGAAIPEKPPQHSTAEGETQGQWKTLRAHCVALFSEISSAGYSKPLPPFSPSDWENCHEIAVPPAPAPTWPAPTDKVQGPFRLKNGAWKFIGPVLPTPAPDSRVQG